MIFSMTGYAVASAELDACSLSLELRSVNHRYLDLQIRMPDELRLLEPVLREKISSKISRGKVECRINLLNRPSAQSGSSLNHAAVRQLAELGRQVRELVPEAAELTVSEILKWNGVIESPSASNEALHSAVEIALEQALLEFSSARQREGEKLASFLLERAEHIDRLRLSVAPLIPEAVAAYETRLRTRLIEALGSEDDERLRQEIALYANKIDVDEELSRLQTHLTEVKRVLRQGGIVGKRLDFMMQELHREANTLGSKSVDAEVSRSAMDIKLLIEQMREQVQNIE